MKQSTPATDDETLERNKKGDEENSPSSPRFGTFAHTRPMDAVLSGEGTLPSDGGNRVRGGSTGSKYGRLIVRTDFTVYFSRTQLVVEMPLHLTGMGVALDEKETGGGAGLGVIPGPIFGALEQSADFKLHHPLRERQRDTPQEGSEQAINRGVNPGSGGPSSDTEREKERERERGYTQAEISELSGNQNGSVAVSVAVSVSVNTSSPLAQGGASTRGRGRILGDMDNSPLTGLDWGQDRGQGLGQGLRKGGPGRDRGHGSRYSRRGGEGPGPDPSSSSSDTSYAARGGESGDGTEREAKRAPRGRQAVEGEYTLIELPVATAAVMHFRYVINSLYCALFHVCRPPLSPLPLLSLCLL